MTGSSSKIRRKRNLSPRIVSLLMAAALAASMLCLPAAQAAQAGTAYARTQAVFVDGKAIPFHTYALKDSNGNETNYVKLRDIASVLNGTLAQFQVTWDGAVVIQSKTAYQPDGSEMSTPFSGDQPYSVNTAPVKIDGAEVTLSAIVLTDAEGGAYTYFQLRDLGKALGFGVDWNGKNIVVTSGGGAAAPVQPVSVPPQTSVTAGGMTHTLALKEDGTLLAWGSNDSMQLGQGQDVTESKTPMAVQGLSAVAVAAGSDFSVVMKADGTVWQWGYNRDSEPQAVDISGVTAIAAGQTDILAVKDDGTVWQWYLNEQPAQVPGLTDIVRVSGGNGHCLALDSHGDVYAWGNNHRGQLGDGTTESRDAPVQVSGLAGIVDVAAGTIHSLAAGADGTVYAWGCNSYGELGNGEMLSMSTEPQVVQSLTGVVQVSAGNETSMALTQKGEVYTWGYGEYGQLGNGTCEIACTATIKVDALPQDVVYIASGMYHNLAVTSDGALYTWGRNKNFQLGTGNHANSDLPQHVLDGLK